METFEETPGLRHDGKIESASELTASTRRVRRELEAQRREIERWRAITGGDQGLVEALLLHSPHGIIVCDSGGRFVLQNRAAERIWAGSATIDGVDGWGVYRAFHPDGRPFEADDWSMARCLTRREIVEAEEVHFQRFDGTHGILLGSCAPILGSNGALDGALSVFADITPLKQMEERLQLITDSLPALISYVDASLHYRFANRSYERWFGLSRAEVEARHPREVLGDEAFDLVEPYVLRALRGETVTFQTPMPYRRGGERFIEATYIPHLGPDRSVLGLVVLVNDISERKRIERERARWAERTEHLLRITEALTDAVTEAEVLRAVVDCPAAVLRASSAALWLADPDGGRMALARSIGEVDGDGAAATLPLTVEGRKIGELSFTFERAVAPSDEDQALLVVVARHSAQALERVRLLREAEIAYTETTLLYRLTDAVNRAQSVEEVYETSLDTIQAALGVGRASISFFDGGGALRLEASRGMPEDEHLRIEGRKLERVPLVYESRLLGELVLCRDARRSPTAREENVARSIADQIASAVGRKRAQQEKERLIERLSQTVRLNELFAGVVGHDLRSPLSAIINTAQLALQREDVEHLRKPLRRVLSAGERMSRMIEQLLDFTRARSGGRIPVDPQPMDLGQVGRRVLDEVEDAHPERNVVVEMTGDLRGVWDPDRLAQVVSNLAGNAVQHGAPEARVSVCFDGRHPAHVVMRVANGGALPRDLVAGLFEPFRCAELRKRNAKGLGLGLYITQQIVLAHGGTIEASSSADDATTTFTVTLPR
jgi:PAS domain S-box-containing protein